MDRRRKNTILGLWSEDGKWCDDKESISAMAVAYFQNIYTTSSPSSIEQITRAIPIRITREMNEELIRPFTGEEVTMGLFGIAILKSSFKKKNSYFRMCILKTQFHDQYCQYCILSASFYIQKSQFDYEKNS